MPPRPSTDPRAYWRANLRVIAVLLAVWLLVGPGLSIVLVEPLNRLSLGGFPLGFWFAQQGAILVFIALILVYALWMERVDRRHGGGGDEPPPAESDVAEDRR